MELASGSVAVITGGASGIGLGLAEALADRGASVVLADIREDALAAASDAIERRSGAVTTFRCDVADLQSVEALRDHAVATFGRVDLVCNNAGVVPPATPMWEQTESTWDRMIAIKVMGVVHGVRAFAPLLLERGTGHFLNTASSGGLVPLPQRSPYAATMHAVVGLTETLDIELRQVAPEVGATVLCPGLVDTALGANSASLGVIAPPPGGGGEGSIRDAVGPDVPVLTPREVADSALDAVLAGRVHVAPGAGVADAARARVEALLADLS